MGNYQLLRINTDPLGPWLRRLVAGSPQQSPAFHPKSVRVRFITDKVQCVTFITDKVQCVTFIFKNLQYFQLGIVPLMLHIHISFIHHQKHTILANASVIQKGLPPNKETASLVSKRYSYSVMKHILMKIFIIRDDTQLCTYLFSFVQAKQTDRDRKYVVEPPFADPQNQAKYRARVRFSGRYEDCRHLECTITWPRKPYWRFGQNVLPPWPQILLDCTSLIVQNDNLESGSVFMSWRRLK